MFLSKFPQPIVKLIQDQYEWCSLIIILAIGTGLRFYKLATWSFWVDELFTLHNALTLPQNLQQNLGFALREHPVSSALIYTAVSPDNINEFNARVMLTILGILSIPLFYWLIKKQQQNVPIALLFALFLAVSPWHIYWSQNSRFYITMLIFYWSALFAFYWGYEHQKRWVFVVCIVAIVVTVSERLLGLFIIPVIIGFVGSNVFFNGKSKIQIWQLLLLGGIGLSAMLFFGYDFIREPQLWFDIYSVSAAISPQRLFIRHLQSVDLHIVVLALIGTVHLFQTSKKEALFWVSAIIIPLGITLSFAFFQFTHPRYIFVTLPAWLFLAAVGAYQLLHRVHQSGLHWVGLTAVMLLFMVQPISELQDYYTDSHGGRLDLKTAFFYVQSIADSNDIIFTNDPVVGQHYLPTSQVRSMRLQSEATEEVMNCQIETSAWFVMAGEGRVDYSLLSWVESHTERLNYDADRLRIFRVTPENCL